MMNEKIHAKEIEFKKENKIKYISNNIALRKKDNILPIISNTSILVTSI